MEAGERTFIIPDRENSPCRVGGREPRYWGLGLQHMNFGGSTIQPMTSPDKPVKGGNDYYLIDEESEVERSRLLTVSEPKKKQMVCKLGGGVTLLPGPRVPGKAGSWPPGGLGPCLAPPLGLLEAIHLLEGWASEAGRKEQTCRSESPFAGPLCLCSLPSVCLRLIPQARWIFAWLS